jgi:pimeloyl-ACP methyl ester carboxylesterase
MSDFEDGIELQHGVAQVAADLRLHYVMAGQGARSILLLHGFPQTWWEWRSVIPFLVRAGYRVIAPDYRGAGNSQRPVSGYDKRTMAQDLRELLRTHLQYGEKVILVGHDIGLMVAFAYAQVYPEEVSHLVLIDAPLPGTKVFDTLRIDPRVWHFAFHGARDVAEMLVAGKEELYLKSLMDARSYNPSALTEADRKVYTTAYSAAGAMRAGFELYRSFDVDAKHNRESLEEQGKIKTPVLAVGGEISNTGALMGEMAHEVAEDVTAIRIPRTGHWIPEEAPKQLSDAILQFISHV